MRAAAMCCVVALTVSVSAAPAPEPQSTAVRDSIKSVFDIGARYIVRSAEQIPESLYGYRPTPDVRTFSELFTHIAGSNYQFCTGASREDAAPGTAAAESAKTKAEIQKVLADSFAFCDRAFATVNDTTGGETTSIFGGAINSTRLGILSFGAAHNMEHYGNIVTYMRLNTMVPPSSQQ